MGKHSASAYADGDEEKVLGWVVQATQAQTHAFREARPAARVGVLGEWWRRASVRDILGAMGYSLHDLDAQCAGCAALTGLAADPSRCATLQGVTAKAAQAVVGSMRKHLSVPRVQAATCICISVLGIDTTHRESLLSAGAVEQLVVALRKHPLDAEVQQYGMAGLSVLLVENNGATARAKALGAGELVSKALAKKHWGAMGCFVGQDEIQRFGEWLQQVFGAIVEPEPEPEPGLGAPAHLSSDAAERDAASSIADRREKLSRRQHDTVNRQGRGALDSPGPRKTQPESPSSRGGSVAPITHYLNTLPFQKAQASSDGVERNLVAKDHDHAQNYLDQLHGTAVDKARGAGPSPEARRRYARLRHASPPPKPLPSAPRTTKKEESAAEEINSGLVIPPSLPPAFGSRGKTSPADVHLLHEMKSNSKQQMHPSQPNAEAPFPIENNRLLQGNLLDGGYRVRPDAIANCPSPLQMRDPELYAILTASPSNSSAMSSPPKQAVAKTITQSETSLQPDSIGAAASKTVALGGVNAKAQRAVLAAEQEAAVAELARRIEAEAEQSYALHAEAQQVQAERERVAHAEAEKAAMLEFAESIGTTVRFEDNDNSITGASPAVDDDGRKSHKQPPPWKMTHMQPGTNLSLQTDQLARELSTEVGNLRGRLESGSGQAPRLRPVSAAAPTPSMIGPRLEMICDNLGALPRAAPVCPSGYRLRTFRPGDEAGWCACFHQWTAGPHESYSAAGWTPARLERWFNMDAGQTGGCGIREPSKDLFLIERCDVEEKPSIVATACVWTTASDTKKTVVERNGAKVVIAMPYTGEINWVASMQEHRGKGLGDVVTLAALQRLHELGKQGCWLETDDWRIAAIKIYLKYGFRKLLTHDSHKARWEVVDKICASGKPAPNVAPQLM